MVASAGAGFVTIRSLGPADRLTGFRSPACARPVLHTHVNDNGMMRMREVAEPWSLEAKERNRELVEGKTLLVRLSPTGTDVYGRLVGSVELADGRLVEEVLVSEGLARVVEYEPGAETLRTLKSAEASARSAGKGIWSPARQPEEGGRFIASSSSSIYHVEGCPKASGIKPENRVVFDSEAAARTSKRTPCRYCLGGKSEEQQPVAE